jgi:hypothetical protein
MEALGYLNHDPHLVGSIFTRRAADERLAGLDIAARVWSTMKQLLGDSSAAQKLACATAASKDRAYLVVMGANRFFTLIHHLTIMDVELRPRDPIKGHLVAFEADMREDGAPPGWWYSMGPPRTFSNCSTPNWALNVRQTPPISGEGDRTSSSWAYGPCQIHPRTGPH